MEMDHPETLGWLKDALAEETVGLRLHHHHLEWSWKRITTDSREAGEGDVFVAIPGERATTMQRRLPKREPSALWSSMKFTARMPRRSS